MPSEKIDIQDIRACSQGWEILSFQSAQPLLATDREIYLKLESAFKSEQAILVSWDPDTGLIDSVMP